MAVESTEPTSSQSSSDAHVTRCPLFVCGHPRSGTTLLRAVLSANSQVHLVNEPDLIVGIRSAGFKVEDTFGADERKRLIDRLNKHRGCRRHLESLCDGRVDEFLAREGTMSFKEVFEFLLPRPTEPEIWGAKSLQNMYFIEDILQLYPNAIIIHIVRDPRAALLSTYRKRVSHGEHSHPPFGRESIAFFAYETLRWKAAMDAFESAKNKAGESLYELLYEDLVQSPEEELSRLCSAIGMEFETQMVDAAQRKNDPVLRSENAYAHSNIDQTIDASRAASGGELPDWASYVIRTCLRESTTRYGHDVSQRPSVYHRLLVGAGVGAFRGKMEARLDRELRQLHGAGHTPA